MWPVLFAEGDGILTRAVAAPTGLVGTLSRAGVTGWLMFPWRLEAGVRALVMKEPSDGTDRTEVREADEPRPGVGEVAIEVACAGVNFLDVMARRGDPGYAMAWPYVPGLEVAGTVRATGQGVDHVRVGQRVAAFTPAGGGLAEVALAPATLTVPVPDNVPLAVA